MDARSYKLFKNLTTLPETRELNLIPIGMESEGSLNFYTTFKDQISEVKIITMNELKNIKKKILIY